MSGRKYAKYELERNIRESLQCKVEAWDLLIEAGARVNALAESMQNVPALKSILDKAQADMAEIQQKLAETDKDLTSSKLKRLSSEKVRTYRADITNLRRKLEEIIVDCRKGQTGGSLRVEIASMLNQLNMQQETIRPWTDEAYDNLHEQVKELLKISDQELHMTGSVSVSMDDINDLLNKFSVIRKQAAEIRFQDEQRRYVLEALLAVCKELGFAGTTFEQDRPDDDLIVDVNTYSHGVIRFRLMLDGTIRSASEMVEASCGERFTVIEDKLRNIGVVTGFRYEGDQRPVRLERNAKSLPDDSMAVVYERV